MKLYVPSIGDAITLTKDWKFNLTNEYRNRTLFELMFGPIKPDPNGNYYYRSSFEIKEVNLPKGTVLTVDRIYIKKGMKGYDSITFVVKKAPFYKKGKLRFWVKLKDANEIEFEPYQL